LTLSGIDEVSVGLEDSEELIARVGVVNMVITIAIISTDAVIAKVFLMGFDF
jgi:hypothetical protein